MRLDSFAHWLLAEDDSVVFLVRSCMSDLCLFSLNYSVRVVSCCRL